VAEETPVEEHGEFWQDAGPEFNPETAPESPEPEQLTPEGDPLGWTPDGVVEFMEGIQAPAFNALVNPLLGVEDVDWTHRHARLQVVAPAIAREWNKVPMLRSVAGHTDRGLILSYLLLEYLGPRAFEVVAERKERAAAAAEEAEVFEATGVRVVPDPVDDDTNDAGPRVTGLPPRRR
jgi:hypothetical protein